jgi:hypothetical protein
MLLSLLIEFGQRPVSVVASSASSFFRATDRHRMAETARLAQPGRLGAHSA